MDIFQDTKQDISLEEYYRKIDNALYDFTQLERYQPDGINLLECPVQVWNAALQYVSNTVFTFTENGRKRNRVNTKDYNLLKGLLEYYIYLCNSYNKVPSLLGFSYYMGYSYNTVYDMRNGKYYSGSAGHDVDYVGMDAETTRLRSQLLKSIKALNEQSLIDRLANNPNPVGMIAAGNVSHNWDNRRNENTTDSRMIESNVISSKYLQLADPNDEIVSNPDTIPELPSNDLQ